MGPIRPATNSSCTLCHMHEKNLENTNAASNTCSGNSTAKELKSTKKCKAINNDIQSATIAESNQLSASKMTTTTKITNEKKKMKKFDKTAALVSLEMPRKSPREHASTLAILSCLLQKKNAQQQQEKEQQEKQQQQSSSILSPSKHEKNDKSDYGYSNNSQICVQISENVKKLRRGERASIAATSTTTSATTTTNSTNHLLGLKRKATLKQRKNMRKFLSKRCQSSSSTAQLASLSYHSVGGKKNLQFDIDPANAVNDRFTEKHVNVMKLKKDIDAYLTAPISDNDDLIMESALPVIIPTIDNDNEGVDDNNEENFPQFSQDLDLYDLIQQQQEDDNSCSSMIGGSKSKSYYSGGGFNSYKGSICSGNNRFRLFKIYPTTSKKRKNKTGWPTTKKRTATRQHTRQLLLQQQHQQQQQEHKKLHDDNISSAFKLEGNSTSAITNSINSTMTATSVTATTTSTTTSSTANITSNSNSHYYQNHRHSKTENNLSDLSTQSPITPPESDNENNDVDETTSNNDDDYDVNQHKYHEHHVDNAENDNENNVDDDKNDCDEIVSNSTIATTDCRSSTITHTNHRYSSVLHHSNNFNHYHNNHHHNHHHQHQNNLNLTVSDKTDGISDIFTVSSDSLDTVLDVGSQIKSEDQEEIIASSKCNGNNSVGIKLNSNHHMNSSTSIVTTLIGNCVGNNDDNDINDEENTNTTIITQKTSSSSSPSLLIRKCPTGNFPSYINNKKIKYSNSINTTQTTLSTSLLSPSSYMNSNDNSGNTNNKINSRKLSTSNNGKELKVVVVVKRERNNSTCSSNPEKLQSSISGVVSSSSLITTPTTTTATAKTKQKEINNIAVTDSLSTTIPQISPRRLRKPRGRWYRER